ncbi:MAG: MarR family transcriptional regulator [Deltaproteobacteria bacterium]|nr:MarR family transcriptional regulator [Deltaproteobacteria bacterium]
MASPVAEKTPALDLVLCAFRLANVWGQVGNRLAGTYGLTAQQWLALTSIGLAGEAGITPTEIGKSALVSPQNVTGLLDRLERAGYVQRRAVGGDRRSYRVQLSEKGRKVLRALNPLGTTWAQKAAAEFSAEKITLLRTLLDEYLAAATNVAFANGHPGKPRLPARSAKPVGQGKGQRAARVKRADQRSQQLTALPLSASL